MNEMLLILNVIFLHVSVLHSMIFRVIELFS